MSIAAVVVVIAVAATGIYLRIKSHGGSGGGDSGTAAVPEGGAEQVSSATTFSTDVAIPVEGAKVVRDTLVISVTASAQAAAARQARTLAQVDGRVTRVVAREDQRVAAGDLLLQIDTTEYALALDRAHAGLAKAQAAYREQTLFDDQIQDTTVRNERARLARAKSGLEDAELAVREAELKLARTHVRAPFAGRVASLKVVEGVTVRTGDELVTVLDIDPIRVEVQVLEAEVGLLAPGRRASISFAAFPGETFTGTIQTINPQVEDTRTARVTVIVPNHDGRILPGMYARVSLEARKFPDRILVPRSAILERDRRTMLFVFEGDTAGVGQAKWRYVTTGHMNDSLVEIVPNPETEMVQPGEWVLTDGHYTLTHDAPVRLVESVQAAGGRPQ